MEKVKTEMTNQTELVTNRIKAKLQQQDFTVIHLNLKSTTAEGDDNRDGNAD